MTLTDRHRSSADTINPQQNESHEDPDETESVNIEHALVGEQSAHQHRKYKPKTTYDLYVPSTRITEGAVRSYLRNTPRLKNPLFLTTAATQQTFPQTPTQSLQQT